MRKSIKTVEQKVFAFYFKNVFKMYILLFSIKVGPYYYFLIIIYFFYFPPTCSFSTALDGMIRSGMSSFSSSSGSVTMALFLLPVQAVLMAAAVV